jgi:hypothetical protein
MEVPVLVCLHSSCCHVTEVGGTVTVVSFALKVVMQTDRDFVNIILLYLFLPVLFLAVRSGMH